jgi:hypothetical protein
MHLEQRQVLERGGVQHDVRLEAHEDLGESIAIADVGDDEVGIGEQRSSSQRRCQTGACGVRA